MHEISMVLVSATKFSCATAALFLFPSCHALAWDWEMDHEFAAVKPVERHVNVRKVISPERSPDRFSDPRRALIGGVCRLWQCPPRSAI
jgi:hypothetical protein